MTFLTIWEEVVHYKPVTFCIEFFPFPSYVDFSANSQYPRLTFGAPWDFDLSSGNKQSGNIVRTEGDFIKAGFGEANFNPWLYLLSQTDFYETLIKKYNLSEII